MIINYALMGSNDNPLYLDFWPVVSKVWKIKFGITPVLGFIGDENKVITDEYGLVFKFKPIPGVDNGLLSQLVRLFLPKFLNGNCIVTDIDMIPLSKKYFITDLKEFNDDEFIILSSHHHQTINKNQYPMCYVVGNDKIYKELFNLHLDWENWIKSVPNIGWYTDQIYLYDSINKNKKFTYKFPRRSGDFYNDRIDRIKWSYDVNKLQNDGYVDCHSLRPYVTHKQEIDKLIDLL